MLLAAGGAMGPLEAFGAWVQGLQTLPYGLLAGLAGVAAVALVIGTGRKLRAYRAVVATPTARIADARQGPVALAGQLEPVDPDNPVIAPFSGRPCAWYRAWMEQRRGPGPHRRWQTVFSETDPRPCLLDDGTGTCAVMVAAGDARPGTVTERWSPDQWSGSEPPVPLRHAATGGSRRDVRFCEERLEPGPGYAIGRFATTDGTAADDRAAEAVEMLAGRGTESMAELGGRPDRDRPNPRPAAAPGRQPDAVARWLRRQGLGGERIHVLGAGGGAAGPLIVGRGEHARVAARLRRGWTGCSVGLVIAAAAFALVVLGRHGAFG